MAREKPLYRDTLERLRTLNDQKFGGKLVMSQQEAAELLGISKYSIIRKGIKPPYTCEKLAYEFS